MDDQIEPQNAPQQHREEKMQEAPHDKGGIEDHMIFSVPTEEDLPDLFHFLNRNTLATSAFSHETMSIDRVQAIVSLQGYVDSEGQMVPGIVGIKKRGLWIALFFITEQDALYNTYALSCFFDLEYSYELLQEAFELVLNYMFLDKKAHRLEIDVLEQKDDSFGVIRLLQNAHFCFEGIKRNAVKRPESELQTADVVSFQPESTSLWIDAMSFSLLSQEREDIVAEKLSHSCSSSFFDESEDKLLHKARYEGIESIIVRAVVMKKQEEIHDHLSTDGTSSPHDLCLLLLKRKENTSKRSTEELPGGELKNDQETIQDALSRTISEELGSAILTPVLYLTSFDFMKEDGKKVREFVFRVTISGDIRLNEEHHASYRWVPLQYLVKSPLHPEVMTILFSCRDNIDYISETHSVKDEEVILEEVRSPLSELYDSLAHGLHVNAYAARGFGLQEMVGISLRDRSGHLIGGVLGESQYGSLYCQKLWIDPQFWGQGWEKRIVERIEQVAKEKGARFIVFSCMDWEMIRPLQRFGYRIEWQRSGYDRGSKLLYLRKEL